MEVVRRTMAGEHIFPDAPPSVEIGTATSAEFTKGEMKVLRCLVRGLSYNEIAKELGKMCIRDRVWVFSPAADG